MVASSRVQTLSEGSALLDILGEYLKNPKLMKQLTEEVQKINALSKEQEDQLHESQILIQKRDALIREIAANTKDLSDAKADHEAVTAKRQKDSDDYVATNKSVVDKANKALDDRKAELDDYNSRLNHRESQLTEKAAVVQSLFTKTNAA